MVHMGPSMKQNDYRFPGGVLMNYAPQSIFRHSLDMELQNSGGFGNMLGHVLQAWRRSRCPRCEAQMSRMVN